MITEQEIRDKAPSGATHYFQNEWVVVYHFYCKEIGKWLAYNSAQKYWTSSVFPYRIPLLKPL